jgi:hypothetical protein
VRSREGDGGTKGERQRAREPKWEGGGKAHTHAYAHTQTLCRNCLHNAEFYSSQLLLGRALGRYLDGTREGKAF